jgi:hypothetical protein
LSAVYLAVTSVEKMADAKAALLVRKKAGQLVAQ